MISACNILAYVYPKYTEFHIVSASINVIYIPIIVILFGLVFQILSGYEAAQAGKVNLKYDWRIFGIMVSYVASLLIPMTLFSQTNPKKHFFGYLLYNFATIVWIIIVSVVLAEFIPIIFLFNQLMQGYTSSLFNSVVVADTLICITTSNSLQRDDKNGPYNLYTKSDESIKISTAILDMCKRAYDGFLYLLPITRDKRGLTESSDIIYNNDIEKQNFTHNPIN